MSVSVTFCGAAGTVTGSCYLVRHPRGQFLVDCGLFQGSKTLKELNYGPFPFAPREIDAVLITHAHIDHSGLAPKLWKSGYEGRFFATESSRDLLGVMLPDSGYIQESEVRRLNQRNAKRGAPSVAPIYTRTDAEAMLDSIAGCAYDRWIDVAAGVRARFFNAGHILGSASIEVEVSTGNPKQRILRLLFSGDLGPGGKSFHPDPDAPANYDYLFVESTYGSRDRAELDGAARRQLLRGEIEAGLAAGGNIVIPAFAVERTQELLYDLGRLFDAGDLPATRVFLDSPLAIEATAVFARHLAEMAGGDNGNPFAHPSFHVTASVEESKAIARIDKGAIIIAASGMCDAGRIRHHLKNNLWSPRNTVLLVGYQAAGTLGSLLLQGTERVRIHGEEIAVKARIRNFDAYSGHADRSELLDWVRARLPVRGAVFLVHGEEDGLMGMREGLENLGCEADRLFVPRLDESFALLGKRPRRAWDQPPRMQPKLVGKTDWHNHYAAFLLDLRIRLRALTDNGQRGDLLKRLRGDLASPAKSPARRRKARR